MGSIFSSASLTTSGSTEFAASAEATEKLFRDMEAAPSFIPQLLSLSITRGGSFEVGLQWREERIFAGRKVTLFKSITKIRYDPFTVSVSLDFKEGDWDKKYAAETITIVIQPVDDKSCRVSWTMAYVSAGICGAISACLRGRYIIRRVRKHIEEEMDCYALEASRRAEKLKADPVKANP